NKLRFDLAREIVVLVSGGVVLATFAYIINDFLNVQISSLSEVMRDRFATPVGSALLLISAFRAGAVIRTGLSNQETPSRMATTLGETPRTVSLYHAVFILMTLLLLHGVAWWIVETYLVDFSWLTRVGWELAMIVTTGISSVWYRERRQ